MQRFFTDATRCFGMLFYLYPQLKSGQFCSSARRLMKVNEAFRPLRILFKALRLKNAIYHLQPLSLFASRLINPPCRHEIKLLITIRGCAAGIKASAPLFIQDGY